MSNYHIVFYCIEFYCCTNQLQCNSSLFDIIIMITTRDDVLQISGVIAIVSPQILSCQKIVGKSFRGKIFVKKCIIWG